MSAKKQYLNECVVNICIFIVLAVFATQAPGIVKGAREIPIAYIALAALANAILLAINLKKYRAENDSKNSETERSILKYVLLYMLIIGAYVFIMKFISYIVSTYLFVVGSLLFLKIKNKWLLIILPVTLTMGLYFMFTRYLYVFPPAGTLITIRWY